MRHHRARRLGGLHPGNRRGDPGQRSRLRVSGSRCSSYPPRSTTRYAAAASGPTPPGARGLPRPGKRDYVYLTHAQVRELADEAGRWHLLVLVLAYTGLRWGEATALRVCDIDLARRRIDVRRAFSDVGGTIVLGTPKSHQSRTVPVPRFYRRRAGHRHDWQAPRRAGVHRAQWQRRAPVQLAACRIPARPCPSWAE